MSIKKFLFNGSEEKVSKSALDKDIVQELYPQMVVTFTGYTRDLTSPQCDVEFNDIADAFAQGVHISLRHRDVVDAITGQIREIDLSPMLTFDSDGVLVRVEGTHVDSGPIFQSSDYAYPYDTYVNYTNQSLEVYGRFEGNNVVVNPDDPPINVV